jgi:hypothetical protein
VLKSCGHIENDIFGCQDDVEVPMPIRNGGIFILVQLEMNFGCISKFRMFYIKIAFHYSLSCKVWERLGRASSSALSCVGKFGPATLGLLKIDGGLVRRGLFIFIFFFGLDGIFDDCNANICFPNDHIWPSRLCNFNLPNFNSSKLIASLWAQLLVFWILVHWFSIFQQFPMVS